MVFDAHVDEEGLDLGVIRGVVLLRELGHNFNGRVRVFVVVLLKFLDELRVRVTKMKRAFASVFFVRRPEIRFLEACTGWIGDGVYRRVHISIQRITRSLPLHVPLLLGS